MKDIQVIVFDLDDTLYKEIDFVRSGFRAVAQALGHEELLHMMLAVRQAGGSAFQAAIHSCGSTMTPEELVPVYRRHKPHITLERDAATTLQRLHSSGAVLGLITDGTGVTQGNKIAALGLERWMAPDHILISEVFGHGKPHEACYRHFMDLHPQARFTYVGDNLSKDFVTARRLGWDTVCLLDDGRNIFAQDFDAWPPDHLPDRRIHSLTELLQC